MVSERAITFSFVFFGACVLFMLGMLAYAALQ